MEICKKLKMSPGFKEKEQSSANAVLCDLSDFIINLAFVDLFPIYIFGRPFNESFVSLCQKIWARLL